MISVSEEKISLTLRVRGSHKSDKHTVCGGKVHWNVTQHVKLKPSLWRWGWSRAAISARTNIPSSGPPAASQAGSDPAAWCSEGRAAQWSNKHIQGRVSTHAAEGKKKNTKKITFASIYSRLNVPCRVVLVQSAIHSGLRSRTGWCMLRKPSSSCSVFIHIYTHAISIYQV